MPNPPVGHISIEFTPNQPRVFIEQERPRLQSLFRIDLAYLAAVIAVTLGLTVYFVAKQSQVSEILVVMVAGVLGSATAALVSCLDRRANGFEDSQGGQTPESNKPRECFNAGMHYWFLLRPWLGAVMAAVVYWGLRGQALSEKIPVPTGEAQLSRIVFFGFIAGLLAKSVIDILRGLLKNIFK